MWWLVWLQLVDSLIGEGGVFNFGFGGKDQTLLS